MTKVIICLTNDILCDRRMLRIANSLAKQNYQVQLVGVKRKTSPRSRLQNHLLLNCTFQSGILFYLEYNIRLLIFLLRTDARIIYSVDLDTMLAGYLTCRLKNKKHIFDSHEYFTEVPELAGKKIKKSIWTILGKLTIPKTDMRWTVSKSLAKALSDKYKTPFEIIRNMPFRVERKFARSTEIKTLVYLGVLNEGRGLRTILHVLHSCKDLDLMLIGAGDIQAELKSLSKHLGLGERVHFMGRVQPDQIWNLLARCDLGINLLRSDSLSYKLSLANKFFDFVQAELPFLQINYSEYASLYERFPVCRLVDDCDVDLIVNTIRTLQAEKNTYRDMVTACRNAKIIWNWENEQKQLFKLLDKL